MKQLEAPLLLEMDKEILIIRLEDMMFKRAMKLLSLRVVNKRRMALYRLREFKKLHESNQRAKRRIIQFLGNTMDRLIVRRSFYSLKFDPNKTRRAILILEHLKGTVGRRWVVSSFEVLKYLSFCMGYQSKYLESVQGIHKALINKKKLLEKSKMKYTNELLYFHIIFKRHQVIKSSCFRGLKIANSKFSFKKRLEIKTKNEKLKKNTKKLKYRIQRLEGKVKSNLSNLYKSIGCRISFDSKSNNSQDPAKINLYKKKARHKNIQQYNSPLLKKEQGSGQNSGIYSPFTKLKGTSTNDVSRSSDNFIFNQIDNPHKVILRSKTDLDLCPSSNESPPQSTPQFGKEFVFKKSLTEVADNWNSKRKINKMVIKTKFNSDEIDVNCKRDSLDFHHKKDLYFNNLSQNSNSRRICSMGQDSLKDNDQETGPLNDPNKGVPNMFPEHWCSLKNSIKDIKTIDNVLISQKSSFLENVNVESSRVNFPNRKNQPPGNPFVNTNDSNGSLCEKVYLSPKHKIQSENKNKRFMTRKKTKSAIEKLSLNIQDRKDQSFFLGRSLDVKNKVEAPTFPTSVKNSPNPNLVLSEISKLEKSSVELIYKLIRRKG